MGRQDVRQALVAMDGDERVRERLAQGDFAAVDGLELSAEEQTLVQDAANDMPEVAGFALDFHIKLDGVDGESSHMDHKFDALSNQLGQSSWKWQTAHKYGFKY